MMNILNNKSMKLIALTILSLVLLSSTYKSTLILNNQPTISKNAVAEQIEGVYSLNSCENGRFKIKIDNKSGVYFYNILDQKKIIGKGKVKIIKKDSNTYLVFGKIEGIFEKKSINIQNYGNSMNEYAHFTQCEEKYLSFIKIK